MVEQALIAASGYGTRLSPHSNPDGCKSLITYGGQEMIGHLIDGLVWGGIKRFVFCTGEHTLQPVNEIVHKKGIRAIVEHRHHKTYRRIPLVWLDQMEDQFLFVCGHHPLPARFVSQIIAASTRSDCVMTVYPSRQYPLRGKSHEIVYEHKSGEFLQVEIHPNSEIGDHEYARNPYVVKRSVVDIAQALNFEYSFSYYIFKYWQMGGSVSAVEATMPPEFDYDDELDKTRLFIDSLAGQLMSTGIASAGVT
jgi:NDP-sugar pyrophosphorylase family protein